MTSPAAASIDPHYTTPATQQKPDKSNRVEAQFIINLAEPGPAYHTRSLGSVDKDCPK